ncbi:potassium channel family protein [Parasphingopyxis sp. CP4]|uniref:potassium channel family protein n=1 Tax=Parasphingopyxis sp. CP4 TaxID=2724527 RepID=UPI0015A06BF3|nr:potassium channel family protein [Parasphingopyxis sp. CP4]QLC21206.1 potassium channel family protein [Parasphingopyxis sp. CP4]
MVQLNRPPNVDRNGELRRKSGFSRWGSLWLRGAVVFFLVGVAVAVHWFDRAGYVDHADGNINFADAVYFTMVTITTVGYGDITPVTDRARLFEAILVTPIRLFIWLIFLGTAYDFLLQKSWSRWRMSIIQKNLHNHIVVAGFGISGSEAVDELLERGIDPSEIVVIDQDHARLEAAEKRGCNVMEGDASRDKTLNQVRVSRARSMIVSAGRDDTSILVVLTARALAPKLAISVLVRASDNEQLARQAGASNVINPVSFAGLLLAGSCHGPHISDYMADLASATGRVALRERMATHMEEGLPLGAIQTGLGVRIYRNGKPYGFWEEQAKQILEGDLIVEIVGQPDND